MKEKKTGIYLQLFVAGGEYLIPFKNIEQLDDYTVQFKDKKDLKQKLFGDYAFLVEEVRIINVFKTTDVGKTQGGSELREVILPLKYYDDNYDEKHLRRVFQDYLETHPEEIRKSCWHVIYAISKGRNKTYREGNISSKELSVAIDNVWAKGYKGKRDIYFNLKRLGFYVETKPTELFLDRRKAPENRLNSLASDNPYIEYLVGYSKQGDEELNLAMEQLSMFDLEELLPVYNTNYSAFDGVSQSKNEMAVETFMEHIDTLSRDKQKRLLEELYQLRDIFNKSNGNKRCKK